MAERVEEKSKGSGKERLIQAAQKLAQERPFDEITIDDIIKAADLSRPAFYYHFAGGKEELRGLLVQCGLLKEAPTTDVRQSILEAALNVFARCGTSAATLDDIAAEAGVTRGTLTWHFHNKEDLLEGILKNYGLHSASHPLVDEIDRELQESAPVDVDNLFHRLAAAFYDGYTNKQGCMARLAVLVAYTHPEVARLLASKILSGRKHIVEYIQKGQQEGRFCKKIDANLFVNMLAMTFAMRAISEGLNDLLPLGHLSREELIDQVVSLLLYGLVERNPQQEQAENPTYHPCE
jgi:TetR/AcrR family transcriptional regulator